MKARPAPYDLLDPPEVAAALDDIPGGQPGLLPLTALGAPLQVKIPRWLNSNPQPEAPERLWVYWDDDIVHTKTWNAPVPDADLVVEVPVVFFSEGPHVLYHRVMTWNVEFVNSHPRTLTVDRVAPVLGADQGRLRFPGDVIASGVTPEYLEQNQDEVVATLPDYTDIVPGDILRYFWDTRMDDNQQVATRTITEDDLGKPLLLVFAGTMIRARGDGDRYVRYQVEDRAGNISPYAGYITLKVTANAPPRQFPWPDIERASGVNELVSYVPVNAVSNGAGLLIPDDADIREDDEVWVQWGEQDSPGSYRSNVPVSPGAREFRVPKEYVAFHITHTVPVHYEVVDRNGKPYVSKPRRVEILRITSGLPHIQCEGVADGLSLESVPATGAKLTLARWMLISADQFIGIEVSGVTDAGNDTTHTVIERRQLTPAEVADGIGKDGQVVIPKQFLQGLRLNFPFSLRVFVSFDQGQTWPGLPNFPLVSINLKA